MSSTQQTQTHHEAQQKAETTHDRDCPDRPWRQHDGHRTDIQTDFSPRVSPYEFTVPLQFGKDRPERFVKGKTDRFHTPDAAVKHIPGDFHRIRSPFSAIRQNDSYPGVRDTDPLLFCRFREVFEIESIKIESGDGRLHRNPINLDRI